MHRVNRSPKWREWAALFLALAVAPGWGADEATFPDKASGWAFKAVTRPAVPQIANRQSPIENPLDAFILARLEKEKLQPAPEANSVTLIRRLTYDLTGLPPTPDEVDAFLKSATRNPEAAIDALADRLLASPRYGERWGRHWLDVVHYGETHGYDKDKLRPNAWPYRDYVIRSLNDDKPYARFVQEQLAGDVLFPDEPDGIVALGFIAAGPWDFVGHVELPITKTDGLIARYNDRDDMVMTAMSTFMSLTVHCARCHDHKFDPITQKDYYALQAVFAGVDRANRPYDPDKATHQKRRALAAEKKLLEAHQVELQAALDKVTSPELRQLDERIAALHPQAFSLRTAAVSPDGKPLPSPSNGYHSNIEPTPDVPKWVQVDLGRSVTLDEVRLIPARPTDFPDTPGFGFPARFKVEISDGENFANTIALADHTAADFKNPGDTAVVVSLSDGVRGRRPTRFIRVTATRLWERSRDYVFALGELQAFADGTNVARGAKVMAHDSIEAGRWARKNLVDGYSSRARLSDAAPTPAELAKRNQLEADTKQLAAERQRVFDALVDPAAKTEIAHVEAQFAELNRQLAALPALKMVYAAAGDFAPEGSFVPAKGVRPVHQLLRGDVKRPAELMSPAALPAVPGPSATFALPDPNDESARRAALARWITDPKNLLARRSIVNRVWQYHFGRGLVETPGGLLPEDSRRILGGTNGMRIHHWPFSQ